MTIGEIGNSFSQTHKIEYYSTATFLEFDAIIIDFKELLRHVGNQSSGTKPLFLKRKRDLEEFILHKKVPIIYFAPQPRQINFNLPGRIENITFNDLTPIPNITVTNEQGSKIQIVQRTPFTDLLTKYAGHFHYDSFFETSAGKTIVETPHTRKVLGFYDRDFVFLPPVKMTIKNVEKDFLSELLAAVRLAHNSNTRLPLPKWAELFYLPKEKELTTEIVSINERIDELKKSLELKEAAMEQYYVRKKLFTASGDELEEQVKILFKELGFEIVEAENNRDDLILKYNDQVAVVEIKGIGKSAAERHAAQLEKWSANYIEKNGIIPKGFLIVNSFKDLPLDNRVEDTFPHQMIKYSTQREHCLITTIQLLNLFYKINENLSDKDSLIQTLFNTNGVYQGFENWNLFLEN